MDTLTGKIAVKTLGFSAYVIAAAPIPVPVASTPPMNSTTPEYTLSQTPPPVKVSLAHVPLCSQRPFPGPLADSVFSRFESNAAIFHRFPFKKKKKLRAAV